MLNYKECGFETGDELLKYIDEQRDLALLSDDDDTVSSFEEDLSASFIELTDSIPDSELYFEFISREPMNEVSQRHGYSLEATLVSPEIIFWNPTYMDEDDDWEEYWDLLSREDFFARGGYIVLKPEIDPASNPVLNSLVYSDTDFWIDDDSPLKTIKLGLAVPGLNLDESDFSQDRWVFRLFGKLSGLVDAASVSEAKSIFAKEIQNSFYILENDSGTNKFNHHEYSHGEEKNLSPDASNWFMPIEHVFVKNRNKVS